jgi:hypothetical protein
LYRLYLAWGPDPFAIPIDPDDLCVEFTAWTYAKERSPEIANSVRSS